MDILDRFHLALSYLEKSEEELEGWERVRDTDDFDHSQYDLVKSRYLRHVAQAHEVTDAIRSAQFNNIEDLEDELRAVNRQQRKLIDAISAGKVKTKDANRKNRVIANEQARYTALLDTARTISDAETTGDLGGRIQLTFEEFIDKLDIDDEDHEPKSAERSKSINANNVAILVLIGIIAWAAWTYYDALGKASWRSEAGEFRQTVKIRCTNTGDSNIRVYTPWPEGTTTSDIPPRLQRMTFGALLYVREKGKKEFQLLPESPGVWTVNGELYDTPVPTVVSPGERLDIVLNVLKLRQQGINVEAVRLEYTRFGGSKMDDYELIVSN